MTIDWQNFTPWSALAGGALIGFSAALFVLLNGRIAGVSGVLGGLLKSWGGQHRERKDDVLWRVAFVAGLVVAPVFYAMFAELPKATIDAGYGALIFAGLLVGVGTWMSGGCTSGHGVCGLSRLSLRSLVATLTFMAAGFVTVFVMRHVL